MERNRKSEIFAHLRDLGQMVLSVVWCQMPGSNSELVLKRLHRKRCERHFRDTTRRF